MLLGTGRRPLAAQRSHARLARAARPVADRVRSCRRAQATPGRGLVSCVGLPGSWRLLLTSHANADNAVTLAEGWNGVRWAVQRTPRLGVVLDGVSCPSVSVCFSRRGQPVRTAGGAIYRPQGDPETERGGVGESCRSGGAIARAVPAAPGDAKPVLVASSFPARMPSSVLAADIAPCVLAGADGGGQLIRASAQRSGFARRHALDETRNQQRPRPAGASASNHQAARATMTASLAVKRSEAGDIKPTRGPKPKLSAATRTTMSNLIAIRRIAARARRSGSLRRRP